MKLHAAMTLAERIQRELAEYCEPGCCQIVGSVRRARPEVNDIDFVVLARAGREFALRERIKQRTRVVSDGKQALIVAWKLPGFFREGAQTDTRGACAPQEFQFDFWFAHAGVSDLLDPKPTNFGSLLLLRTGSKEHNIKLAQIAKSRDMAWKTSQGIFAGGEWVLQGQESVYEGGKLIASETEQQIFEALGLNWISPALRELNAPTSPSIGEILNNAQTESQPVTP